MDITQIDPFHVSEGMPAQYSWEYYLKKMDTYPVDPIDRLSMVIEMQGLMNFGSLEIYPQIQEKLRLKGYYVSQDKEEIANFKNNYLFLENQGLRNCVLEANEKNGLLIGLQTDYERLYPSVRERSLKETERSFEEAASIADKWAMKIMDQEWSRIRKNKTSNQLDRQQIYFCNRFMKMGLVQFECSLEMKQLMERFHLISQRSFNVLKNHLLFNDVNKILEKGIEILQCNRDIWENDQNADLNIIDTYTEKMMNINISIREAAKVNIGITGLKNLTNSCYMNASIHLLCNIPDLVQKIKETPNVDKSFLKDLCNLINSSKIDNEQTLKNLRMYFFNTMKINLIDLERQQDAHEFFIFTLDQLGWNPLKTHTCIRECNKNDRFSDEQTTSHLQISFDISDDTTPINLQKIINTYSQFEKMDSLTEQAIQMKNSPEYVILHLVRFEYDKVTQKRHKKCNPLHYSLNDSLKVGEGSYRVEGWINHLGKNMDLGHYTAVVKRDGIWIRYNDDNVNKISPEMIGEEAYIVLLKRINEK